LRSSSRFALSNPIFAAFTPDSAWFRLAAFGTILIRAIFAPCLIGLPGSTKISSSTPETRGLISTSWRGTIAPVATVFLTRSCTSATSVV
jgi:hypothetical protein